MSQDFSPDLGGMDRVQIPGAFDPPRQYVPPAAVVPAPKLASTGDRVAAFVVEQLIWALGVGGAFALFRSETVLVQVAFWLVVLGLAVVNFYYLAEHGFTIGKKLLGLRVVDESSFDPIGWRRGFARQALLGLLICFTFSVGFLINVRILHRHPRKQGWHDRAAGSVVLSSPAPQPSVNPAVASTMTPPGVPIAPVPPRVTLTPRAPNADVPRMVAPPPPAVRESEAPVVRELGENAAPVDSTGVEGPAVKWSIELEDGALRPVPGLLLVGRSPVPGPDDADATAWAVTDPGRSMSKTHAAFGVAEGQLWVEDRHSTNGVVVRSGSHETACEPMKRVIIESGDRVLLGERVFLVHG